MTLKWLLLAYGSALITNIISFSGVLALVYWIDEKKGGLVGRYHDQVQVVVCWLFAIYLFVMATLDANYPAVFWGDHWSYYNLMIIAGFLFNLLLNSKVNLFVSTVTAIGCLWWYLPGDITLLRIGLVLVMISIQGVLTLYGPKLWYRRLAIYPLLAVYGGIGLAVLGMGAPSKDGWFWFRQVLSLGLQSVLLYEYLRILVQIRHQNKRYRQEAKIDRMTGLKNFGTFSADLLALYQRYQDKKASYWLIELDIDHFKQINDAHGHLVGNTVLITVAKETQAFASGLPYHTAVYRMGGEEFCVLLEGGRGDVDKMAVVSEQLRHRLSQLNFCDEAGEEFQVTVSLGAERIEADDQHYLDIYSRVDQNLYAVKRAGRNGVNVRGQVLHPMTK